MPGYKIHSFFGIFIALTFIYFLELSFFESMVFLIVGIIYSLLPDIDISSSKISGFFTILGIIGLLVLMFFSYFFYSVVLGIILILIRFLKHRGFIHSVRAALIFSIPLLLIDVLLVLFGFLLYLLHLGLDGSLKW